MDRRLFLFVSVFLFLASLVLFFGYQLSLAPKIQGAREKLKTLAFDISCSLKGDELLRIPLRMEGDSTREYKDAFELLSAFKESNPSIKYIYVLAATEKQGILKFIVDADPLPEVFTSKSPKAFPGEPYDARNIPAMLEAFDGPSADRNIQFDDWGVSISGYAPVYDSSRKVVGIVGVDMDAAGFIGNRKTSNFLTILVALTGCLFLAAILPFMKDLKEVFRRN